MLIFCKRTNILCTRLTNYIKLRKDFHLSFNRKYAATKIESLNWTPKISIVGSGPAALYTTQHVMKKLGTNVKIDIYEKLPVPFGLVRYGVAPDHQDVKNVINSFTETMKQENIQFFGNVGIGTDLKISDLQKAYDCVVLAYGSLSENSLNIPGEKDFVISAKDFVGWYNGVPELKDLNINLKCKNAVIVGAGNVALDIARILLSPVDKLKQTDISSHSLEKITSENQIKSVYIVARRGVLNVAYTLKELRELTKIESVNCYFDKNDFKSIDIDNILNKLSRPRKRLLEYMYKIANENDLSKEDPNKKSLKFVFCQKPIEVTGNTQTKRAEFVKFKQYAYDPSINFKELTDLNSDKGLNNLKLVDLKKENQIDANLVIRSIGYKNVNIDNSEIPFDKTRNVIPNDRGKVLEKEGLYCTGWIKRGPKGVIVDTTSDAYETADKLCIDLHTSTSKPDSPTKPGSQQIIDILNKRNIRYVDKNGWYKIDSEEIKRGKLVGKPREKLNSIDEMLKIAFS